MFNFRSEKRKRLMTSDGDLTEDYPKENDSSRCVPSSCGKPEPRKINCVILCSLKLLFVALFMQHFMLQRLLTHAQKCTMPIMALESNLCCLFSNNKAISDSSRKFLLSCKEKLKQSEENRASGWCLLTLW